MRGYWLFGYVWGKAVGGQSIYSRLQCWYLVGQDQLKIVVIFGLITRELDYEFRNLSSYPVVGQDYEGEECICSETCE